MGDTMSKQNGRSIFKNAINNRSESIGQARKDIGHLKAHREEMVHIANRLFDILGTNEYDLDKPRVDMHMNVNWDNKPQIYVSYRGATGFKDDGLMVAMAYLMGVGFDDKGKGYESAESLNREYEFSREDINVKFDVYVRSDSPTCRKVVIGEETLTMKKYKIECD
jgi:hypothetical protein